MTPRALHRGRRYRSSCGPTIVAAIVVLLFAVPGAPAQDAPAPDAAELLHLANTMASQAARKLEDARQAFQRARQGYETGTSSFADFSEAQLALADADMRLKIARLDVAEIEAAGGPVRIDLAAPLIDGRDFLSERLQIEFDLVARRSAHVEAIIELTEAEVEAGVAMPGSMGPLTIERSRLAVEAERIRTMLELRRNEVLLIEQAHARQ